MKIKTRKSKHVSGKQIKQQQNIIKIYTQQQQGKRNLKKKNNKNLHEFNKHVVVVVMVFASTSTYTMLPHSLHESED